MKMNILSDYLVPYSGALGAGWLVGWFGADLWYMYNSCLRAPWRRTP